MKKLSAMLSAAFIVLFGVDCVFALSTWDGTSYDTSWYVGNESATEYVIATAEELAGLAKLVNEGTAFGNKTVKLGADLSLAGKDWTPIGGEKTFNGSFDGQGYKISDVKISVATGNAGLFGKVGDQHAVYRNVTLENVTIVAAGNNVGAFAGNMVNTKAVENIDVKGTIGISTTGDYVGGVIGYGYASTISLCDVDGTAATTSTIHGSSQAGGIIGYVGESYGTREVRNNTVANIAITADKRVGSVAGTILNGGKVMNNTATDVTLTSDTNGGDNGLVVGRTVGAATTGDNNDISGVTYVVNNTVNNVGGTAAGAPITVIAGIRSENENGPYAVNGTGVTFDEATGKITGGTFERLGTFAAENDIAAGYSITDNGNGSFTVTEAKVYVAEVGEIKFSSLQEAIDAANGDAVKLIADCAIDTAIRIPAGATVEIVGNDHALFRADDAALTQMFVIEGALTIDGLTVDAKGSSAQGVRVMDVTAGSLTLNNSVIKGGYGSACALYISGGEVAMNSGSIEGNTVASGNTPLIYAEGSFFFNGGRIAGNNCAQTHHLMRSYGGTVYINGEICNNKALNYGGPVYLTGNDYSSNIQFGSAVNIHDNLWGEANAADAIYDVTSNATHLDSATGGTKPVPAPALTAALQNELAFSVAQSSGAITRRTLLTGTETYSLTEADLAKVKVYLRGTDYVVTEQLADGDDNYVLAIIDNRIELLGSVTVTFTSNYEGGPADVKQQIPAGFAAKLAANPFTREGYAFKEWRTLATSGGTPYADGDQITINGDITLYAQWTRHVATVTIDGVATGYTTIEAALTAAKENGGTLTLSDAFTPTETLEIAAGESLTLDLNGFVLQASDANVGDSDWALIRNLGTLVIQDTSATGEGRLAARAANDRDLNSYSAIIVNQGNLTIQSGTIWHYGNTDLAYGIYNDSTASDAVVTINGGSVQSQYVPIYQHAGSSQYVNVVTITGGTIDNTSNAAKAIIVESVNANANKASLTISDKAVVNDNIYLSAPEGGDVSAIEVSVAAAALATSGKTIENALPGYVITENNGIYGVALVVAENTATGVKYETLQAAIAAANTGDTILVLAEEIAFPAINKQVTLRSKKATKVTSAGSVSAAGVVIDGFEYAVQMRYSATDLTIKNCKFTGANGLRYCYAYGTWMIEDCIFDTTDTYGIHFDAGSGSVNIIGCELSGYSAFGSELASVNVTDCIFRKSENGNAYSGFLKYGNLLTITDSEFKDSWFDADRNYLIVGNSNADGVTELNNCKYENGDTVVPNLSNGFGGYPDDSKVRGLFVADPVKDSNGLYVGGVFGAEPAADKLAEGYVPTQNADGTYGVQEMPSTVCVVIIGEGVEREYESLQEAIDDISSLYESYGEESAVIQLKPGTFECETVTFPAELKNVAFKGADNKATVLKNTLIRSADGNTLDYQNITFDGIVFDNSQLLFTGHRTGAVTYGNWTITNCEFRNIDGATSNNSAVHFNLSEVDAMNGFAFTDNVIDGVTHANASGLLVAFVSDAITISGNRINNVKYNAIQIGGSVGVAGKPATLNIANNEISNTGDRAIRLGNVTETGTTVSISGNAFTDAADADGELIKATKIGTSTDVSVTVKDNAWTQNGVEKSAEEIASATINLVPEVVATNWIQVADTTWYNEADSTFTLTTAEQLAGLAKLVNEGKDTFAGKTIKLDADIDLAGKEWTPIGVGTRSGSSFNGTAFSGVFDGASKTISGLTIKTAGASADAALGFFGGLKGTAAKICNLKFAAVDIDVASSEMAGAAAGMVTGGATVEKIEVLSGTVAAKRGNGGIVGRMTISGAILNCTNAAAVTATGANLGGIVGAAYYTGDYSEGTGVTPMRIENCKNTGTVTSSSSGVGGIVGLSSANVVGNTNEGTVTAKGSSVGGIVGEQQNYGTVAGNVNKAEVSNSGDGGAFGTGGIVGWVRYSGAAAAYPTKQVIKVTDNNNSGSISGANDAGGIIGTVYNAAVVTGNMNSAASLSGAMFAGGIVGNLQTTETPILGTTSASETIPESNITVTANTTATTLENISAPCAGLFCYKNDTGSETVKVEVAGISGDNGVTGYHTLQAAIDAANAGDTVTLLADCTISEKITIPADKNITIDGKGFTVSRADGCIATASEVKNPFDGTTLFYILGKLTIKDLTIDAKGSAGAHIIGVTVMKGQMDMHDSVIKGGYADAGSALFIDGTVNMYGGSIEGNSTSAASTGGIIWVYDMDETPDDSNAYFNMYSGKITGNTGGRTHQILRYHTNGYGYLNGEISGNTAQALGGVLYHAGGGMNKITFGPDLVIKDNTQTLNGKTVPSGIYGGGFHNSEHRIDPEGKPDETGLQTIALPGSAPLASAPLKEEMIFVVQNNVDFITRRTLLSGTGEYTLTEEDLAKVKVCRIDTKSYEYTDLTNDPAYELRIIDNRIELIGLVTITFSAEGAEPATQTVKVGAGLPLDIAALVKAPTKSGYAFKAWYLSNGGYTFGADGIFHYTSNVTLTAQWEEIPPVAGTLDVGTLTDGAEGEGWNYTQNALTISEDVKIVGTEVSAAVIERINIAANANVVIEGLTLTTAGATISVAANATANVTINGDNKAGTIVVPAGATLNISDESTGMIDAELSASGTVTGAHKMTDMSMSNSTDGTGTDINLTNAFRIKSLQDWNVRIAYRTSSDDHTPQYLEEADNNVIKTINTDGTLSLKFKMPAFETSVLYFNVEIKKAVTE